MGPRLVTLAESVVRPPLALVRRKRGAVNASTWAGRHPGALFLQNRARVRTGAKIPALENRYSTPQGRFRPVR